jgi:hypothetical protein
VRTKYWEVASIYRGSERIERIEKLRKRHPGHYKDIVTDDNAKATSTVKYMAYLSIVNDFLQAFLTLATVAMYFIVHEESLQGADEAAKVRTSEAVLMIFVTLDALKNYWLVGFAWGYFTKRDNIIDVVSIIPYWLAFWIDIENWSRPIGMFSNLGFFHILQIFRLLRILRLWTVMSHSEEDTEKIYIDNFHITTEDLFVQNLIILFFTLFTCVFLGAAISYEFNIILGQDGFLVSEHDHSTLEYESEDYFLMDAIYLILQYTFTLNYKDIFPNSGWSRLY